MLRTILLALLLTCGALSVQAADTIDINTADEQTLASQLTGIGPAKAKAIVKHREQNGPFHSVDELTQVSGIGDKTLEDIRDKVSVSKAAKGGM